MKPSLFECKSAHLVLEEFRGIKKTPSGNNFLRPFLVFDKSIQDLLKIVENAFYCMMSMATTMKFQHNVANSHS